ncbi:hypothetical protein KY328_04205 [Candidatus Woesearchaeota archaeon]|nr:hypothetical protein [Candidatus Woesearchaeota archaeon]MBW3022101.1 hypothetical protein [Candidatus Woesearchaeota archaeon]
MVKFRCTKCNFEMEPYDKTKKQPFDQCPYCGRKGTMVIKRHILEEI